LGSRRVCCSERGKQDGQLAAALVETYLKFVGEFVDLLNRMAACDRECSRIDRTATAGELGRLLAVELHARGLSELWALRRLQRNQEPKSAFVFTSERGAPFTTAGFARMIERAGAEAKLRFRAHPHMLRHACGYGLANKGHDTRALQAYLGHRNIQHTVRYTELSPTRFKDFWRT
jgi:site-specific recombinase XerD